MARVTHGSLKAELDPDPKKPTPMLMGMGFLGSCWGYPWVRQPWGWVETGWLGVHRDGGLSIPLIQNVNYKFHMARKT